MTREFHVQPPVAPPFIFVAHVYFLLRFCVRACRSTAWERPSDDFRTKLTDIEEKQLVLWENLNVDEYQRNTSSEVAASMENQVKETNDRVDQLSHRLEEMAESSFMLQSASSSSSSQPAKLPPALDERMTYLEDQMKRTSRALDWIIDSMIEKGTGLKSGKPKLTDIEQMREEAAAKRQQQADKEKEQYQLLFLEQLELHIKARSSHYPCSYQAVMRFHVPNAKVKWQEEWSDYEPVNHTDKIVLEKAAWSDNIDLLEFDDLSRPAEYNFNGLDEKHSVDRRSHHGEYPVKSNLPLNIRGRTGLCGRGLLGRWGPNHASDPIVTRWCRSDRGEIILEHEKRVLEFVAIYRHDSKQWAIPGGMLKFGLPIHHSLKIEFVEEALGDVQGDDETLGTNVEQKLDALWKTEKEVYRGYSDDHRNTDNAWIETVAMNYHDEEGNITKPFELKAGEGVEMVRWMKILSHQSLYGGHLAILQKVAKLQDAAF